MQFGLLYGKVGAVGLRQTHVCQLPKSRLPDASLGKPGDYFRYEGFRTLSPPGRFRASPGLKAILWPRKAQARDWAASKRPIGCFAIVGGRAEKSQMTSHQQALRSGPHCQQLVHGCLQTHFSEG
jgi:hypothetical protein